MTIWIFLWIILSLLIFGIFTWSNYTLILQKRAWKALATRRKLRFRAPRIFNSATVVGKVAGYRFSLFSEEQPTEDIARRRFTSVLMFELQPLPFQGVVATSHMRHFIEMSALPDSIKPEHENWRSNSFITTNNQRLMHAYITEYRLKALMSVMHIKNGMFLYAFDSENAVLRLETVDPLLDYEKLDAMLVKLEKAVKAIAPSPEELKELEHMATIYKPAGGEAAVTHQKDNQSGEDGQDNSQAEDKKTEETPADDKYNEDGVPLTSPFLQKLKQVADRDTELPAQTPKSEKDKD